MMRRLLSRVAVVCLVVVAVVAAGCSGTDSSERDGDSRADWDTYRSSEYSVTMEYPSEWTKRENVMGAVVAFLSPAESPSDDFRENVNLVVEDLSADPISLTEYWGYSLAQGPKLITDFAQVSSGDTAVAGQEAKQAVYTGRQGQFQLKFMVLCTIRNHRAYTITYTAEVTRYSDYIQTADGIMDSFDFT